MALGLFQWIGIGLLIALVLIPLVRWFWKRFDMPSKFAIETMRQQKKDDAEAITIEFTQDKGVVGCTAAGTGNYVKFTAKAYSAPADGDAEADASGAMHLGAAFAAGALTIAATQF